MSQVRVERARHAGPVGSHGLGDVPRGGEQFIHRAMRETGCSRSLAVSALRMVVRRHQPQAARLGRYLAKFSAADLAYWIEQALSADRAALATLLIGEFTEQVSIDRFMRSEADQQAEADRRRSAFARAHPVPEPRPATGMQRLDAALAELRRSSPEAATAIDAIGGVLCDRG